MTHRRVLRGASWNNNDASNTLSSNRNNNDAGNRNNNIGLPALRSGFAFNDAAVAAGQAGVCWWWQSEVDYFYP